jgi:hypothetical protein
MVHLAAQGSACGMFLVSRIARVAVKMVVRAGGSRGEQITGTGLERYFTQYFPNRQHSGVALALPSPWGHELEARNGS